MIGPATTAACACFSHTHTMYTLACLHECAYRTHRHARTHTYAHMNLHSDKHALHTAAANARRLCTLWHLAWPRCAHPPPRPPLGQSMPWPAAAAAWRGLGCWQWVGKRWLHMGSPRARQQVASCRCRWCCSWQVATSSWGAIRTRCTCTCRCAKWDGCVCVHVHASVGVGR